MTNPDTRIDTIAQLQGEAVAQWADQNAAEWVIEILADARTSEAATFAHIPPTIPRGGFSQACAAEYARIVEKRFERHQAEDPHCTCNDCSLAHFGSPDWSTIGRRIEGGGR